MWKPLSVIAALLLGGSAALSYFNKQSYLEEQEALKLDEGNRDDAKAHVQKAASTLETNTKDLETSKEELAEQSATLAQLEESITELDTEIEERNSEKEEADLRLSEYKEKLAEIGDVDQLKADVERFRAEKVEADRLISNRKSSLSSAVSRKDSSSRVVQGLKHIQYKRTAGLLDSGFTARVRSVDPNWGFVTINAGNNRQVVPKAKLDITRGGSVIGQIVITDVEQSVAVGDLVSGEGIRAGDKVVVSPESNAGLKAPAGA